MPSCSAAFSAFDTDADGKLTTAEFASALRRVAPYEIGDDTMARVVERIDRNGDGIVSIEEWLADCQRRFVDVFTDDVLS